MSFAVALIDNGQVKQRRYIDDILGSEYHFIIRSTYYFSEAQLDLLCFHEKIAKTSYELSKRCYGV